MRAPCSVDGCDRPVYGHGWCSMHYQRWRRTGDLRPSDPSRLYPDDDTRFWAKVDKAGPLPSWAPFLGPCWLWQSASSRGYGYFGIGGLMKLAHRHAYLLLVGPVPDGLELDHLCRVPLCVNPAHLEPVTHQENVRRQRRIAA